MSEFRQGGPKDGKLSRRMYLILKTMDQGVSMFLAAEAVSSVAIEHPEWDMDERKTIAEWEESALRGPQPSRRSPPPAHHC